MHALNYTETKWRVFNALIQDQPLTTRQIKDRVMRQCGLSVDLDQALSDLYLEGYARHDFIENDWARAKDPESDIGEECLWECEDEDENATAIMVRYYASGEVRVEVMRFENDPAAGSWDLQHWECLATNKVPDDPLPSEADAILKNALAHYGFV